MTVCVGAICKSGNAVVVCADRMLSYGPPMNLQAEGAVRKIYELNGACVLLFSGSVPDGEAILRQTIATMQPLQHPDVSTVANIAGAAYQAHKMKRVEDTILGPLLGTDYNGFRQIVAQSPSSQTFAQVLGMISQHNLQIELMIAGVDGTGAHLAIVSNPGTVTLADTVGTVSIGSGGMHAAIRMSLGLHEKEHTLAQTLYNVHEAKLAAEISPGVGQATDIAVLNGNGVHFVDDQVLAVLKKIHKDRPLLSSAELKKLETASEGYDHGPASE